MNDMFQPFTKLATANAELMTSFAQSPATFDKASASLQKYYDFLQQASVRAVPSESYVILTRKLAENYLTFAQECSANASAMVTQGQKVMTQQMELATERFARNGKTAVSAIDKASDTVKQLRAG